MITTRTQGHKNSQFKPVKIWADIVTRILSYEDTGLDTFVNVLCVEGELREITASMVSLKIKACVDKIGIKRPGFTRHDVGTHSIRTYFASMLSFQQVDTKHIMLQGRWKAILYFDTLEPTSWPRRKSPEHYKMHKILILLN